MNNLKDIHNQGMVDEQLNTVVLSGFQWTIWRIYTTRKVAEQGDEVSFYQDFNEQFEGYTQLRLVAPHAVAVVLSGFQWTIWRIYTTHGDRHYLIQASFYQDFNEQFVCKSTEKMGNMQIYKKLFWYLWLRHYIYRHTCTFEGTDLAMLAHLEATVAKCCKCHQFLCKNTFFF